MAGANIDYNIPEIWSPDHTISRFKLFWDYGTKNMLWPVIKYKRLLKGTTQPYLDNFSEAVSHYILKKKKPNLMAIHFTELDTMRHIYGLKSKESLKALKRIDQRIERLIQTLEKNGQLAHTNIVLLGDHGTHDFDTVIEINSLFKREGLLETDSKNKIISWQAYGCTCGGSCQIHIHEKATEETRTKIKEVLEAFTKMPETPLRFMLTHDEATEKYNLSGDFSYILEAKDCHVFRNSTSGKILYNSKEDSDTYIGDHGFMPEHPDQKTLLLMKGPSIKKGAVLLHSHLIDEGPTFAALLGLKMEKVEGRVLEELMHL
jgi:predicted AlkP superfamily pyrophosphatase or phosphodiesterase